MKNNVKEPNQDWLDKKERLREWSNGRLWYLKNYQPLYYRWLQSNKILQSHLAVVAEQAEELYDKLMSQGSGDDFWESLKDDTDLLCAVCENMNNVLAIVMREVLFARPSQMRCRK